MKMDTIAIVIAEVAGVFVSGGRDVFGCTMQ